MSHVCKLCGYSTDIIGVFHRHLVKTHSDDPETEYEIKELYCRRPFTDQQEEGYMTDDDLKQIVGLPLEESLRIYIQLRNFNCNYKKFMNVVALNRVKAMVVSEDGAHWVPEITRRCANVLLDCYIIRLAKFEDSCDNWNANVKKLVTEVPTGITTWDNKKRAKPLQHILEILQFLSDCEYPKNKLPTLR